MEARCLPCHDSKLVVQLEMLLKFERFSEQMRRRGKKSTNLGEGKFYIGSGTLVASRFDGLGKATWAAKV